MSDLRQLQLEKKRKNWARKSRVAAAATRPKTGKIIEQTLNLKILKLQKTTCGWRNSTTVHTKQ